MTSIPLYLTHEHTCSYLPNEMACSAFVHPAYPLTAEIYAQLLEKGFRRSGNQIYRPHCNNCSACIPLRIPVKEFKPSRSQKRTLQKNAGIKIILKPADFNNKHFDLYNRYQISRHRGGEMARFSPDDYMNFLTCNWCDTLFIEFSMNGELIGIAVTDVFENSISAVYTFFNPDFSDHSPGVFSILSQIEYARKLNLNWLYLGFWIEKCPKMAYKANYRPVQALINGRWTQYKTQENIAG